jgi:hypothetical protein
MKILIKRAPQGGFMKDRTRWFPPPASLLFLAPTLLCAFADAQSASPSGTFGSLANASQIDSNGSNGGAFLGVLTFDGAGNVTGTTTLKPRNTDNQNAQAISSSLTGTYSSNPDGTITLALALDIGFTSTLTMVPTDGGQGFQFVETDCTPCGADAPFQGQALSLTGGLPIALFLQGATGNIPLSLTGVNSPGGGSIVYTAAAANGSGTAQCQDGSKGSWTASVPTLTIVLNGGGANVHGNFFAAVFGTICGQPDFETLSGLMTGTVSPTGATNLVLHGPGAVIGGIGRATQAGGSLNGSYGLQLNFAPFPAGAIGVMKFDGAGNVSISLTAVGGPNSAPVVSTLSGTYSINPDGSGTINFKAPSGQPSPAYSFVITDGGSQLLLLRTDANPLFDVAFGTARLQ